LEIFIATTDMKEKGADNGNNIGWKTLARKIEDELIERVKEIKKEIMAVCRFWRPYWSAMIRLRQPM